jgi:hypothetical protein
MADATRVEAARKAFALVTGVLEDASVVAADAQAVPDLAAARRSCEHLITLAEGCLGRLHRLRRRLK